MNIGKNVTDVLNKIIQKIAKHVPVETVSGLRVMPNLDVYRRGYYYYQQGPTNFV